MTGKSGHGGKVGMVAVAVLALGCIALVICVRASGATWIDALAVLGAVGSAIGGLAAAFAAWQSRVSAQASEDTAARMDHIAKESRLALGRAMSTQIEIGMVVHPGGGWLQVKNTGMWPAHDVDVTVLIAGQPPDARHLGELGISRPEDRARYFRDVGPLPGDYEDRRARGPVEHRVIVEYSDRERILRHRLEFSNETHFAVDDGSVLDDGRCTLVRSTEVTGA